MNQAVNPTSNVHQKERNFWQQANQKLLVKSLSELSWEEAIQPVELKDGCFELLLPSGVQYRFFAWRNIWGQLMIDPDSITRAVTGNFSGADPELCTDSSQFFIDAREELEMTSATLCNFLEELANTLMAEVQILKNHHGLSAADMIDLPDDELQCLLDGHPKVTVSKGRIGWGQDDFAAYGIEHKPDIQLEWVALSCQHSQLSLAEHLNERNLLAAVLDENEQRRFQQKLDSLSISGEQYFFIPVHPWQWQNRLVNLFADEIALRRIVHLGAFGDPMLPQQSLRTLSNRARAEALNIKLPLSILNTSCYRGIPGRYITAGPVLSSWLANMATNDSVLASRGTIILEEPAAAFYPHPLYSQVNDGPYRYHEMLGCIWRQSVHSKIEEDEQAVLISTLFQKDGYGQPLINEYIRRSGISADEWLSALFNTVVIPLYHLLCKYGVGLVAHGQNITLILKNATPHRVALKDFQGDLRLVNQDFSELETLSEHVRSVTVRLPPEHLIHDLQTGHFVTVLRFISAVMAEKGYSEHRFYQLLGQQLKHYMARHPELTERFALFDLFTPEIARICLNRVRFKVGYGDNAERPLPALGTPLINPLAAASDA